MSMMLLMGWLLIWSDSNQLNQKISQIDHELVRLNQKLKDMKQARVRLSDEINRLEIERSLLNHNVEKSQLQLDLADQELQRTQEQKNDLELKLERNREQIALRLRELYKQGKLRHIHLLLSQDKVDDLITALHYARAMTQRDHERFVEFRHTLEQLSQVELSLTKIKQNAIETRDQLDGQKRALDHLLAKRTRKLKQIRSESKQSRELREELALQREELDMMLKRLTSDSADLSEFQIPIERYRGRLNWPVRGRILRSFGVIRDPEFNTKRRQKGVDIAVDKGTEVRSIYSGTVIYADWFKSYGNLVIVDHGNKVTSFYAHNQRLLVERGEFVERDTPIAAAGDTGSLEGSFLHFEIRVKGSPKDPLKWLKR